MKNDFKHQVDTLIGEGLNTEKVLMDLTALLSEIDQEGGSPDIQDFKINYVTNLIQQWGEQAQKELRKPEDVPDDEALDDVPQVLNKVYKFDIKNAMLTDIDSYYNMYMQQVEPVLTDPAVPDNILVSANDSHLKKYDLKTLLPGQWLNDQAIYSYMQLLSKAVEGQIMQKISIVHPLAANLIIKPEDNQQDEYNNEMKAWKIVEKTEGHEFALVKYTFIPVNVRDHWILIVVNNRFDLERQSQYDDRVDSIKEKAYKANRSSKVFKNEMTQLQRNRKQLDESGDYQIQVKLAEFNNNVHKITGKYAKEIKRLDKLNLKAPQFLVYDSLQSSKGKTAYKHIINKLIQAYMRQWVDQNVLYDVPKKHDGFKIVNCEQQKDGHNCGMAVLMNARAIIIDDQNPSWPNLVTDVYPELFDLMRATVSVELITDRISKIAVSSRDIDDL